MKRTRTQQQEAVRQLLRQNDPVQQASPLDADEAARIKARVFAQQAPPRSLASWWRLAVPVAAASTVLLVIGLVYWQRVVPPATDVIGTLETAQSRQVQFETPGGTRVVWLLNSEFSL